MVAPQRLVAHAADAASGMMCVTSNCGSILQECVKDSTCLRGLGCFVACAANPDASAAMGEGACQVRCVDLYECDTLNAFTKCTLTDNGCYPALAADPHYPPLPRQWAEAVDVHQLRQLLNGRWYVSAGLNPAFDHFACQVHDFTATATRTPDAADESPGVNVPIADATFSYRIALDSKGQKRVTRVGQKRLYLKQDGGGADETQSSFRVGMAWGRDAFDSSLLSRQPTGDPRSSAAARTANKEHPRAQLALTTVPDYMEYEDDWTILSASTTADDDHATTTNTKVRSPFVRGREAMADPTEPSPPPSTDYMVVAYRGRNAAWRGYGGLNVYTRRPVNLWELAVGSSSSTSSPSNPGDEALLRGIQRGLDKVGLTVADLLPVDHDGC
jgi:VDE lipocalin domain